VKHSSLHKGIQVAVHAAAQSLPAGDPCAHVFFENRVDLRVVLGADGVHQRSATRASGGTIAGRESIHASDPAFLLPCPDLDPPDVSWFEGREELVIETVGRVARGRPPASWSARLVSFRQDIWVARAGREVKTDSRIGSRLELRIASAAPDRSSITTDLVLHPKDPELLRRRLDDAFDRLEARSQALGGIAPGEHAAVFGPGAAGIVVHELIGHALEGDLVARTGSWLLEEDDLQSQAGVTVIDDPRRGRGGWQVDDEGTESSSAILIDRSRVVGALHDRASARRLGANLTGHGRRASYLDAVLPRMGCTYIDAGIDDPADILRATKSGVFIRRLVAGHTDPATGRAYFTVTDADRIIAGRCAEPIDTFILELDARTAFRSLNRIAHNLRFDTCIGSCVRDGQPLAVSVGAPTIRIGVVTVRC
jgi:TldD protein